MAREITSPNLKIAESRCLLLTELGSDRVTAEIGNSKSRCLRQHRMALCSKRAVEGWTRAFPGRLLGWMGHSEVEMREAYIAETVGSQVARDLWVSCISPEET
jgi:hypothetical protein